MVLNFIFSNLNLFVICNFELVIFSLLNGILLNMNFAFCHMSVKRCQLSTVRTRAGFGMIEMIVGAAVLSTALLGISTFFQATLKVSNTTKAAIQGDYLLEEGIEALKLLRDTNYTNNLKTLTTGVDHYLLWSGSAWATTTVNTFIDGQFERKFTIANVNRDSTDDIAPVGTLDTNTKLITVYVSWNVKGATTTRHISTYITNLSDN